MASHWASCHQGLIHCHWSKQQLAMQLLEAANTARSGRDAASVQHKGGCQAQDVGLQGISGHEVEHDSQSYTEGQCWQRLTPNGQQQQGASQACKPVSTVSPEPWEPGLPMLWMTCKSWSCTDSCFAMVNSHSRQISVALSHGPCPYTAQQAPMALLQGADWPCKVPCNGQSGSCSYASTISILPSFVP